ncbi:hypothetical protein D0Z03_002467 [Geotrichum reessii]|nr:hypothetical protein D0Z03_002467 [Galactomyces reessii]
MVFRYLFIPALLERRKKTPENNKKGLKSEDASSSSSVLTTEAIVPTGAVAEKEEDLKIFKTSTWTSFTNLLEVDANLHKSNSTYFTDLDLARTQLLLPLFKDFFIGHRLATGRFPYVPLGSVMTVFRREISPLQRYAVRSRVLGWDGKWLFVLSRFEITAGRRQQDPAKNLAAVALSKYVFKDGRKTIAPEDAIRQANPGVTTAALEKGRMDYEHAKSFLQSELVAELPMY